MNDSNHPADHAKPRPLRWRVLRIVTVLAVLGAIALAVFYRYIVSGGLRARRTPSAVETFVAQSLVQLSIPRETKNLQSPLAANADGAAAAAGRELYQRNCEVCHGYDGSGKTAASGGLYPPPLDLRQPALTKRNRTDGELFYFIRNGIRNTGMPGWQLPDHRAAGIQSIGPLRGLRRLQKVSRSPLRKLAQNSHG